jgi:hypothetical protein
MFFGMSNSPATFSRMMTTIFREMLQEGSLVNYMDDFAIPGQTKHQLQERTIKLQTDITYTLNNQNATLTQPKYCYLERLLETVSNHGKGKG